MSIIKILFVLLALFLPLLLRRLFPRRRRLFALLAAILPLAALFFAFPLAPAPPEPISPEMRIHIMKQQQILHEWLTDYQGAISRLDQNWQQYHRILTEFESDTIGIEAAYDQLCQLEAAAAAELARIRKMRPPGQIDDDSAVLVTAILSKLEAYAAEQHQTIRLTAAAADPENLASSQQEEQSRRLRDVMITESPVGLFTAEEIAALQARVTLPE